jgi:hypothetical protein
MPGAFLRERDRCVAHALPKLCGTVIRQLRCPPTTISFIHDLRCVAW